MPSYFKHRLVFVVFILIFLSPYLALLPYATWESIDVSYLFGNYFYSVLQALLSSVATLVFALLGALGLFWLEGRTTPSRYAVFEFTVMAPALLPALFLVIPVLNLMSFFPFGLTGVVIFHTLSEIGIGAIVLKRILAQRLTPYADSARLAGSSVQFLLKKTWPLLRADVLSLGLILFIYFLTSFSIPLLIGGTQFSSLEITLYEKIVVHHDWPTAVHLFLYQFVFIALLLWLVSLLRTPSAEEPEKMRLSILEKPLGLYFIAFPPLLILSGLLLKWPQGMALLKNEPQVMDHWQNYFMGSLTLGFLTAGSVFIALSVIVYFLQMRYLRKFFFSFFTPSFVILAFSIAFLPGNHPWWILCKISAALCFAFVPTLLRFGILQKMSTIDNQLEMASYMGAGTLYVFKKITWPQCLPVISIMSGLAGVWAVGDFSLSRVIAGHDINLAMWVQSLVDQYRWSMALVLSWSILFCALVVFGFFWGLAYVARQKLN